MLLFKYFLLIVVFVSAIVLRKKMMEHTLGAIHRGALSLNNRIEGWVKRQVETHPASPYAQAIVQQRFKKAEMWRDLYKKWRKERVEKSQGPSSPNDDTGGPPGGGPRPPDNGGGPPPGGKGPLSYRVPPGSPPEWESEPAPSYKKAGGKQYGGPPDDGPFGPPEIAVKVNNSTVQADGGQAAVQPQDTSLKTPAFGKLKEGPAVPEGQEKGDRFPDHGPPNPAGPAAQPRAESPDHPARPTRPAAPEDPRLLRKGGNGAGTPAAPLEGHGHGVEAVRPAPRPSASSPARGGLHQAAGTDARPEGTATAAAPPPPLRVPKGAESGPGGPPAANFPSQKAQDSEGRPAAPADSARGLGSPTRPRRPEGADAQRFPEGPLAPPKFKLVSGRRLKMKTGHNSS